ncbi:hypothetical protein QYF36_024408 [Acer negundo]|nr:hypothetical protein QYF36_024408 [Acer negundo]
MRKLLDSLRGRKIDLLQKWLGRTRKLKDFTNVFQVNKQLEERGIEFSSTYLGGKDIVWTFESSYDRDGFINNGFLWRNCFISMHEWRESWLNTIKLKWIEVYRVPLLCWCKAFFKKLGGLMVKSRQWTFPIRLEESTLPIFNEWLQQTLGLNHGLKFREEDEDDSGDIPRASREEE